MNNNNRRNNDRSRRNSNSTFNSRNRNENFGNRRHSSEIKSISTNVNKEKDVDKIEPEDKKKISIIPRIKLFNNNRQQDKRNNSNNNYNRDNSRNDNTRNDNSRKNINYDPINNETKKNDIRRRPSMPRTIIPYKSNTFQSEVCPICSKAINNMSNSVIDKTTEKPCHFECIAMELKKENSLKSNQRLVYLGSSTFGIIEDVRVDGKDKFEIIKKMQYTSAST